MAKQFYLRKNDTRNFLIFGDEDKLDGFDDTNPKCSAGSRDYDYNKGAKGSVPDKYHTLAKWDLSITKFKRDKDVFKELKKHFDYGHFTSKTEIISDCHKANTVEGFILENGHTEDELLKLVNKILTGYAESPRLHSYSPRECQSEIIEKLDEKFKKYDELLLNACMRVGKCFVSLYEARKITMQQAMETVAKRKAHHIVIITPYPKAKKSFIDIVEHDKMYEGYKFYDKDSIKNKDIDDSENFVIFLSWQYLDINKPEVKKLLEIDFDFMIIDEMHRASDTPRSIELIKRIKATKKLYMSGTPYNDILSGYFNPDQIVNFDILDYLNYDKEHGHKLPNLNIYQLSNFAEINEALKADYENIDGVAGFTLEKAFKTEKTALHFLKSISSNIDDKYDEDRSMLKGIGTEMNHIIAYLPSCKSASNCFKALKKLVKDTSSNFYGFKLEQISGNDTEDDISSDDEEKLNEFMNENDKTIIISCGKATTGVTLPKLDTELVMRSISSAELFMQMAFRPMTQCDGKTNANVFLFDTESTVVAEAHILQTLAIGRNVSVDEIAKQFYNTSSCNATALLPALKLIDDKKEILCGDIVTIHPLLNHQRVLDGSFVQSATRDVDLKVEFGRSSTQNIIPSQTTTIKACSYVLEKFNSNLISSNSLRVPTDTVGVINVTLFTKEISSKDEIKNLFLDFEKNQKFPIVLNNFEALVSSDFKKEKFTTIVDHRFLEVKQNMIKLLLWYDNEWGYASKVVEILKYIDIKKG